MHQAASSTVPEPQAAPNQAAAIHALMPLPDLLTDRQSPESCKIQIIHLVPPRHQNNKLVVLLNLVRRCRPDPVLTSSRDLPLWLQHKPVV